MNIRVINLGLSITAICILFIDFFAVNEFYIERGYIDVFAFLLLLNIFRITFANKIQVRGIGIYINLGLLGFLLYNIPILAILSFGVGFTGRSFPVIMAIAIVVNIVFTGALLVETIKLIRTKTKHNV